MLRKKNSKRRQIRNAARGGSFAILFYFFQFAILNTVVRVSLIKKTFERRLKGGGGVSYADIWEKHFIGRTVSKQ